MQDFFEYIYKIDMTYERDGKISYNLVKNIKLFETEKNGYDGWSDDNTINKVVNIEPENWGKVCLMDYKSENSLPELMAAGAHLTAKRYVYDDDIDARIQMAFMANKHGVKVSEIEKLSNGHLSQKEYRGLCECILEEFPEKLI